MELPSSTAPFFLTLLLVFLNAIASFEQFAATITVDINGKGDYDSIQAAVDSVPNGNNRWILIDVKAGVYRAKVKIPEEKGNIMIQGEEGGETSVEFNDYDPGSYLDHDLDFGDVTSYATVVSAAQNVVFKNNSNLSLGKSYRGRFLSFDTKA